MAAQPSVVIKLSSAAAYTPERTLDGLRPYVERLRDVGIARESFPALVD